MFKRGSLWRKWDLHIHTPFSVLNNHFGEDWDFYIKNLFNKAIENEIKAIGITDYFSIEGYEKLQLYLMNQQKMNELFESELEKDTEFLKKISEIAIFPNIELRLNMIITHQDGKNGKVEVHVIFDNTLITQEIQDNFLGKLNIVTDVTAEGVNRSSLTRSNIEKLGRKLILEQPEGYGDLSEYEAGCKGVSVDFKDLKRILETNFKNRYLLLVVEDDITDINWQDQAHMERKIIYTACHGLMSSNPKTISWGLKDETKDEFKSYKPCFWGSDAHEFDKMFLPDMDRFCWIKANTTFLGLKQVLINPKDRIYIGQTCPQLDNCNSNKSNILDEIIINKRSDAKNQEVWFDDTNDTIKLNPYMITIIGNKGSGKSALADIIAYVCDSKNMDSASFLNDKRFKKLPENYAKDYFSSIMWKDTISNKKDSLGDEIDESSVELVQFLPQKYIEEVCSGLGDEFQKEIEKAIFSYMDNSDKEGCITLNELISKKTVSNRKKFQTLRDDLETINVKINNFEKKKRKSYSDTLAEKLKNMRLVLERHLAVKPEKMEQPKKEKNNPRVELISFLDNIIEKDTELYDKKSSDLTLINSQITKINSFTELVKTKLQDIEEINQEFSKLQMELGLKNAKYFTFKIDQQELEEKFQNLITSKEKLDNLISNTNIELGITTLDEELELTQEKINLYLNSQENLFSKIYLAKKIKDKLINETSIETQRYQKYLKDLEEWEKKRKLITGELDGNEEGSIKECENEQKYLKEKLDNDIKEAYKERENIISNIYDVHLNNQKILSDIYDPIEKKLEKILSSMDEKISFNVQIIAKNDLKDNIISRVDQRVAGFFQGATEGVARLNELIASTKFSNKQDTIEFVKQVYKNVCENIDNTNKILKNEEVEFYDYIGSLAYLNTQYMLKLGNKDLSELSPGERGIVLLIFYLALNKSDRPLIIDQPEDNLDNQSVYNKLVPCIKEAKKHRQIIIVTHNPNIAIACDSEQIIYCNIDKEKNKISYVTGSIEDEKIREYVVDVLEGTMPAFDLRRQKYIN